MQSADHTKMQAIEKINELHDLAREADVRLRFLTVLVIITLGLTGGIMIATLV